MKGVIFSPQRASGPRSAEGLKSPPSRALRAVLLSTALLLSRLPEARAQQPPTKLDTIEVEGQYHVECKRVELKDPDGRIEPGCLVWPAESYSPVLYLQDSSDYVVQLHPFVEKDYFQDRDKTLYKIVYMMDGKTLTLTREIERSKLRMGCEGFELPEDMLLGSPVTLVTQSVSSASGQASEIYVGEPGGVLTFRSKGDDDALALVPLVPIPLPRPKGAAEDIVEGVPSPPAEASKGALGEPVVSKPPEAGEGKGDPKMLVSLEGERLVLSGLGEHGNLADINGLRLLFMPDLTDNISLVLGVSGHLRNISVSREADATSIRFMGSALEGGMRLRYGEHTAFLTGYGGISYVTPSFLSKPENRSSEYSELHAEFGARAGYDYGRMHGVLIEGGSNPFMIGLFRLYASLPYSWVHEAYPRLTVDSRLLHLIVPATSGPVGGELERLDLLVDTSIKVPIIRIGPALPSALAGYRLSSEFGAGDGLKAGPSNIYLGGALGIDIARIVHLEAGGAYMFTGDWMAILNASLLH